MDTLGLVRRTHADFAHRWRLVFAWQLIVQMIGASVVMPLVMFDRAASARTVLQASERLLSGVLLRSITPLVAWWLALGAASTMAFRLAGRVSAAALDWAGTDFDRLLPLVNVFLAAGFVLAFVYSTLQFAGHQFLITRIYAERHADALALDGATEQAAARTGRRRSGPVVFGLFVVLALAAGIGGALVSRLNLDATVEVTAHRGASRQAPENTMAAFRAAHAAGAHSAGKQVHVWTVNDPKAMLTMIERTVDNVITDDPATLVRIMRQRTALPTGAQLALALRTLFADPPAELTDGRAVRPL